MANVSDYFRKPEKPSCLDNCTGDFGYIFMDKRFIINC